MLNQTTMLLLTHTKPFYLNLSKHKRYAKTGYTQHTTLQQHHNTRLNYCFKLL